MLEIIILIVLAGKIGKTVEAKGRRKGPYQLMLVGLWFGGEVFGALLGGILTFALSNDPDPPLFLAYVLALVGAIVGAVISFAIVNGLSPLPTEDDFYRGGRGHEAWADADVGKFGAKPRPGGEEITDRPEPGRPDDEDRITR
jgi:uncharacterized membrane protein YeaQ/YmgE (transglycosylase-associated protein family)